MTTSEIVRAIVAIVLIGIVVARRMGLFGFLKERKAKQEKSAELERQQELKREQRERQKQRILDKRRETAEIRLQSLTGMTPGVAMVGGQKIHYAEGGDRAKAAATLVLLHGFAGDKEIWEGLVANLLQWPIYILAPDLPGFGQNDPVPDIPYDVSTQAKRIRALVHGLGIERYHLVGHSIGGNIAAALTYGDRQNVIGLTLVEPLGFRVPGKSTLDQMLEQGRNPFLLTTPEAYDNLLGLLHFNEPIMPPQLKQVRAEQAAQRRQLRLAIWQQVCEGERANLIELLLPEIGVGTLVLQGADSQVVHPSTAQAITATAPQVQARILEKCGHMVMVDRPAETAQVLLGHLQATSEASAAAPSAPPAAPAAPA